MMHIRTVSVELLRAGPRHNQLLSPLTLYLGVCGDAPAGRVTLPYEHRDMEQRLADLNYRVVAEGDPLRRETTLDRTGDEIAGILSSIPGLAGALNSETERTDTLTQLRIVLSASELAMLPFEVSKVLDGAGSSGTWMALQSRSPVCITRHIRSTSAEGMRWPSDPRILFVAGPETPADAHREVLERALAPYRNSSDSVAERLVVVKQATLAGIVDAVERAGRQGKAFSHVHVLAHGDEISVGDRYSAIGVALHDRVVSGKDLATALTSMTDAGVGRPAVVTLATCNSAEVRDVRTPDASVAHDLHDQGIPLVVASQFPLSIEGSLPFVERFYQGQLRGEHPLLSLYHVRLLLRSRMAQDTHDWASVVVYEAFPSDLRDQLEELRYWQARRAQDGALARAEAFVTKEEGSDDSRATHAGVGQASAPAETLETQYALRVGDASDTGECLPKDGPFALECGGLRAAGYKRLAQVALRVAVLPSTGESWRRQLLDEFLRRIDQSRTEYWRVTKAFLGPTSELTRRKANLHWFLGQVLSLDVVRGRTLDPDFWTTAHLAARIDTDSANEIERAWACVSLSELALMRLAQEALPASERAALAEQALAQAGRVVELLGRGSEHVMTTSRQFERYVTLWGNPALAPVFEAIGIPPRPHWHEEHGLVPTARRIVESLRGVAPATGYAPSGNGGGKRAVAPVATRAAVTPPVKPPRGSSAQSPRLSGTRTASARVFNIELLPARNGDCLWIEYGNAAKPARMLVDCGSDAVADMIAPRLSGNASPVELFVLTHIDADHIGGVAKLFADRSLDDRYRDIWFNGWQQVNRFLGVRQGEQFSAILGDSKRHLPWNRSLRNGNEHPPAPVVIADGQRLPTFDLADGMRITLLSPRPSELERLGRLWKEALLELAPRSGMLGRRRPLPAITDFSKFDVEALARAPTKKDPSAPNGSSIAFLAEYEGHTILLTGDAHADVLVESIRQLQRERGVEGSRLKLDAIKLAHHGSAQATTLALLDQVECPRYLVSSNGDIFGHPDREAIARVIVHGGERPTLCFNYRSALNALWEERTLRDRYRYDTVYPGEGQAGIRVRIAD